MENTQSIAQWIALFFSNFGFAMLILAAIIIIIQFIFFRKKLSIFEISFRWIAFFPLGITGLYTGFIHTFFSAMSAAAIGWPNSPFQFEVAMADFALGLLGILSFKATHGFRLATVIAATVCLWGDALGHFYQLLFYKNFARGNAGSWLWLDLIVPFILIICMIKLKRKRHLFLA